MAEEGVITNGEGQQFHIPKEIERTDSRLQGGRHKSSCHGSLCCLYGCLATECGLAAAPPERRDAYIDVIEGRMVYRPEAAQGGATAPQQQRMLPPGGEIVSRVTTQKKRQWCSSNRYIDPGALRLLMIQLQLPPHVVNEIHGIVCRDLDRKDPWLTCFCVAFPLVFIACGAAAMQLMCGDGSDASQQMNMQIGMIFWFCSIFGVPLLFGLLGCIRSHFWLLQQKAEQVENDLNTILGNHGLVVYVDRPSGWCDRNCFFCACPGVNTFIMSFVRAGAVRAPA